MLQTCALRATKPCVPTALHKANQEDYTANKEVGNRLDEADRWHMAFTYTPRAAAVTRCCKYHFLTLLRLSKPGDFSVPGNTPLSTCILDTRLEYIQHHVLHCKQWLGSVEG